MQYFSQSFAIKVKARAHWAFVSTFLLAVAFTKVEKAEIENWFSKTKARSGGKRLALRNHTNNNFFSFWHLLWQEKKKRSNGLILPTFTFPIFRVFLLQSIMLPPSLYLPPVFVFLSVVFFRLYCFSTVPVPPTSINNLTDLFQSIALDSTILQALMKYISLFDSFCLLCIIILT